MSHTHIIQFNYKTTNWSTKYNYNSYPYWWNWLPSDWVLLNANSAICQLYHDDNLMFNDMMVRFVLEQHAELVHFFTANKTSSIFIVLAHWKNRPRVDMSFHFDTLFWFRVDQYLLFLHTVLVWPDRYPNSRPTAFKASTLTISPSMGWWYLNI